MVTADAQVRADGWFTGVLAAPADMGTKKKEEVLTASALDKWKLVYW